jgi:hypothetical protein
VCNIAVLSDHSKAVAFQPDEMILSENPNSRIHDFARVVFGIIPVHPMSFETSPVYFYT